MNPLYFGRPESPLYGAYYPAETAGTRGEAVLLCGPVGQEYMRTHRALHQLAGQLAGAGCDVLRFEYTGIGDSAGDEAAVELATWQQDIVTAARELTELSGASRVALIGVRLGASLAFAVAGSVRASRLVLWDPVVSGAEYLALLERLHAASLVDPDRFQTPRTLVATEDEALLLGYHFSTTLRRDLRQFSLLGRSIAVAEIALVVSETSPPYDALHAQLQHGGARVAYHLVPPGNAWDQLDRIEKVLMPYAAIKSIVTLATKAAT